MKRSDWYPPTLSRKRTQFLPDKVVADVVEAIIGACIADSEEFGGSSAVSRFLGEEYKPDLLNYLELWRAHFKKTETSRNSRHANRMQRTICLIEDAIGYRFKDNRYPVEAITHPSSLGPSIDGVGNCYQRLEYLGEY
jgi:dsRNA-specific ribonuclease